MERINKLLQKMAASMINIKPNQLISIYASKLRRSWLSLPGEWLEDIRCVFGRDPAARNILEVLTTYPGVHAILAHRLTHRLWLCGFHYLARILSFLTRLWTNIDIHPGAVIGRRFFIDHGAGVVIGETAVLGDDVTLYHGVTLGGTSWHQGRRHPCLGNGVLIGAGAKVLGAITLGDNVRVGANSVVVDNIPANQSVVGMPARIVQAKAAGKMNPNKIDLDHHRIPDVVGQAIACLLERIEILENEAAKSMKPVQHHKSRELETIYETSQEE
jgi:serine O-acetyltransferase